MDLLDYEDRAMPAPVDPEQLIAALRGVKNSVVNTGKDVLHKLSNPIGALRESYEAGKEIGQNPMEFGRAIIDRLRQGVSDPEVGGELLADVLMPGPKLGPRKIIAGPKGIEQMTKNAGGARVVKNAVGEGLHGHPIEEIPDFNAKFNQRGFDKYYGNPQQPVLLPDVLEHPELYKAYPELRATAVIPDPGSRTAGNFTPGKNWNAIRLGDRTDPLATLLHETQHNVQHLEKYGDPFLGGHSGLTGGDFQKYWENPGEIEARVVEERMGMDPEMLKRYSLDAHLGEASQRAASMAPEPTALELLNNISRYMKYGPDR